MPSAVSKTCTCYCRAAIDRKYTTGKDEITRPCLSSYTPIPRRLMGYCRFLDLDRNLPGLDLFSFGDVELQDTLLEDGLDLLCFYNNGQGITYSSDPHLLWLEAWQRCLDHIPLLILGLIDVDREGARRQELEARPDKALLKQAVQDRKSTR